MKDTVTVVIPKGIRYLSEWEDFNLPDFQCIIDKKIPGCGFTEYCITNNQDTILCSPRKILLKNKEEQHPGEVLYVNNILEQDPMVDKDLEKTSSNKKEAEPADIDTVTLINNMRIQVNTYINQCRRLGKPVKLLITYDSFRILKDILGSSIDNYYVIVDEFQSIFTDAKFKSNTELSFIHSLQSVRKVIYVSATPTMDKYLNEIDEFKELPFYVFDWLKEDPYRVCKPKLSVKTCRSVCEPSCRIIEDYITGNFEAYSYRDKNKSIHTIYSTEAVFYVNSVNNIINIIKKCNLQPEQCNIIVANTLDNEKKIKTRLGKDWEVGKVPLRGEVHKMFTFCTRTVYLGADFYSKCARTFILSDANIETLAVDINLDLPQILGRQRLNENPWKNKAEFFYKTQQKRVSKDEFEKLMKAKEKETEELLNIYYSTIPESRHTLALTFLRNVRAFNYKYNYIAVNKHLGKDIIPVENKLVKIAEKRSFDIQQVDYENRFSVFTTLAESGIIDVTIVDDFLEEFNKLSSFSSKMKFLCETRLAEEEITLVLNQIPVKYSNYYRVLGPTRCKSLGYNITRMEIEYMEEVSEYNDIDKYIYYEFKEGEVYSRSFIKNTLRDIYDRFKYTRAPKATDLENYFEIKEIKLNRGRERAFKIIKRN